MKRVVFAVLIIFVVVIAAMAIFITSNKDKIVSKGLTKMFTQMENQIVSNLPEGVDEKDVHVVFEKAVKKVQSGEVQPGKIQDIIMTYRTSLEDKKLDSVEAEKIFKEVQKYLE